MKKILLAVLLVFGLTANAQRNYEIESQLKLKTVNAGVKSDSVLVRGADKVVKFVPQSSIGESGYKDLQSVLNTGKSASFDDGVNVLELLNGDAYNRFVTMRVADTIGKTTEVSLVPNQLSLSNTLFGKTTSLSITDGVFALSNNNNNGQTNVIIDEPNTGVYADIRFPAKPLTGSYILATKDDIASYNFQKVIDASTGTGDYEVAYYDCGIDGPQKGIGFKANLEGTIYSSDFGLSSMSLQRYTPSIGKNTNATYDSQYFTLVESTYPDDLPIRGISYTLDRIYISSDDDLFGVGSLNLAYPAVRYTNPAETDKTIPISVNGEFSNINGNISLSSITTTFTTNDGKTVTVTNGVITNIE